MGFSEGANPFEYDGRILRTNAEFAAVQHRFVLVENPVIGAQIERAVGQQADDSSTRPARRHGDRDDDIDARSPKKEPTAI